jgi:hypothetical protein
MKKIVLTIFLTFFILILVVGGIITSAMKTASKGKPGKCEWGGTEKYKSVVCQAYVEKDGPITIILKNVAPKEVFLSASSAIQCSNKNGYFMCVGLMKHCQLVGSTNTSENGEFKISCPIPWGPMQVKVDFNIGSAKITWER